MIGGEMIIDGVDFSKWPRVIPKDVVLIDAFPLNPIPEQLEPVKAELLEQLALAEAPFSGRLIACILAGENEGYGGHVIEHSAQDIEDPFMMAFAKVPKSDRLFGVMIAGQGPMKEKHLMPSGAAYDAIAPRLLPGSPIVVMPPNQIEVCRFIPESRHKSAYCPKPESVFTGKTERQIYGEAIRNTTLSPEDCVFVAKLRIAGLTAGIHFYLTGSAAGHGGPSVSLRPGMYADLDIIAISELDKAQVEATFQDIATAHYGVMDKTPKVVEVAGAKRTLDGAIYSNTASEISIDFFVSGKLEDSFVRQEYFERNYFHQLS